MAIPMQRPVASQLDPELARELRRIGDAIAELQRKLEEPKRRKASTSAEAIQDFRRVLASLSSEAVEDGKNHPAEPLLQAYWQSHRGPLPWQEALSGAGHSASLFADFLRLAGRVRPEEAQLCERLLTEGIASDNLEVRDAAVQAVELWADPSLAETLRRHREEVPWLADYIERVLRDLSPSEEDARS